MLCGYLVFLAWYIVARAGFDVADRAGADASQASQILLADSQICAGFLQSLCNRRHVRDWTPDLHHVGE